MTAPRILSRPEHVVSRKNIDSDAVKVLYRLYHSGFIAYLVGGGVRDLLLDRRPKDFDVSTSAHPQQVKKLFRNCFIVGRRFRLCHIRFGQKVIEVSTFRRQAEPEAGETLIRRDNTFGTPEEDAFRRDFTVNALFYDIGTFSVIDYVGGLEDLEARTIRTIGDPDVRFREDPVRMLRAVALAARLGFSIDSDSLESIRALRSEIVKSSSARILEEMYKILRQGAARETFVQLHETGLLSYLLPHAARGLDRSGSDLLDSLGRLDAYRRGEPGRVGCLSNPLLIGSILVPLGIPARRVAISPPPKRTVLDAPDAVPPDEAAPSDDVGRELADLGEAEEETGPAAPEAMDLPIARRDLDRLRLVLVAQRRLHDVNRAPHVRRLLASRHYFEDALSWLEIHGDTEGRELALHWRQQDVGDMPPIRTDDKSDSRPGGPRRGRDPRAEVRRPEEAEEGPRPRRRRRRRRRRAPTAGGASQA